MVDRIAGEGADDYATDSPDASVSRLGYAGWIQGKIADEITAGRVNPITRATAAGKIQHLASLASFTVLNSAGTSFITSKRVLNSAGTSFNAVTTALNSAGTSFGVI